MLLLYMSASDSLQSGFFSTLFPKPNLRGSSKLDPGFFGAVLQIRKKSAVCKRGWYWSRLSPLARATQNLAILISSTSAPLISPSPIDHRLTCATDVQNIQRCSN